MNLWHVDKGRFDVLVGVYLNDNMNKDHGNFMVWPGILPDDVNINKGVYEETSTFVPTDPPHQIMAKKGSVIVVNRRACHGTAPNISKDYIRQVVWFRLQASS